MTIPDIEQLHHSVHDDLESCGASSRQRQRRLAYADGSESNSNNQGEYESASLHLDQFHDALEAVRSAEGSSSSSSSSRMETTSTATTAARMISPATAVTTSPPPGQGQQRHSKKAFRFPCCTHFAEHSPRIFAVVFGFIMPLLALVALSSVCGYPLALLESPMELDANDFILENQMRLMVEASLYTNLTQALPRICLQLYFLNSSIDEFIVNVTTILDGPPTTEEVTDYVVDSWIQNGTNSSFLDGDFDAVGNAANATTTISVDSSSSSSSSSSTSSSSTAGNLAIDPEIVEDKVLDEMEEIAYEYDELRTYYNYYTYEMEDLTDKQYNSTWTVNLTDLTMFVEDCGAGLSPILDKLFFSLAKTASQALVVPLQFAWSRCPVDATDASYKVGISDFYMALLLEMMTIDWTTAWDEFQTGNRSNPLNSQAAFYRNQWERDRRRLYVKYLEEEQTNARGERFQNETAGTLDLDPLIWHRVRAFEKSLSEAQGGAGCIPNIPAACWFWFTVMTTIGYGNTAPVSFGGKAMVFSLGFLSILLFAMASTRAAYVITAIVNDLLVRCNLRVLTRPWVECFLWGAFWHLGMLLIALYYNYWRKERIGEDFTLPGATAYWFAYISSTSIGFGDYYLEPEVLEASDCITFPIMFLLSFSILASFLSKLAELVKVPFHDGPSLTEHFRLVDESKSLQLRARGNAASKAGIGSEASNPY